MAAERDLIDNAIDSEARALPLFSRLATLAAASGERSVSATVYTPSGPGDEYRVLAWSSGPTEALSLDRLIGSEALFVARGTAGIHLVFVTPVSTGTTRTAVVAAETVLSAVTDAGASLDTPYGPVTIIPAYAGAGEESSPANKIIIAGQTGAPLLEVRFDPATLAERRSEFRRRTLLVAMLPLAALVMPLVGRAIDRGRRARRTQEWIAWLLLGALLVLLIGGALAAMAAVAGLPGSGIRFLAALSVLGAASVVPGNLWWRHTRRAAPATQPWTFAGDHLAAGAVLTAVILALARVFAWQAAGASPRGWHAALFPFDAGAMLSLGSAMLAALALSWGAASILAIAVGRWRVWPVRPSTLVAAALAAAPTVALLASPAGRAMAPLAPALVLVAVALAFAFAAPMVRRRYRRTSQSTRLVFAFLAILLPLLATYPLAASESDLARRDTIATEYAPAISRHPADLRAELDEARQRVDQLWVTGGFLRTGLATLPPPPAADRPVDSQMAFYVWNQTTLARRRAISDVEIYGPDRALVSRFALNLPEYLYRTNAQTWTGTSCTWDVFGERISFGTQDRPMLHAERGLCDETGRVLGAIVLHVAHVDYEALPFVQSATAVFDGDGTTTPSSFAPPEELQFVWYGWSFRPLFTSGQVAWPVAANIFDQLYQTGTPFWTTLDADGGQYHVHFSQDRQGIYALGYPAPTVFEHAARLAELTALGGVFFVALQIGAALYVPLTRRHRAPLGMLVREVRTSFYRKLFLFFVLVAIVPVLVFGLAFGAYMTAQFRADVEFEAKSVVTVARRVFEELTAVEQRPGPPSIAPTDDVMVWIRQVISQDVNLYQGSQLLATSQRHLFDSGLAPLRTPASVYQAVALDRVPAFVGEETIGGASYLIAAAPVTASEPDLIMSVPLAPRQREIERQIDQLYRGVLVGAVLVVLFAAALGASMASRISDPVARLTKATRQIAAGRLDVSIASETADELRRLVDDFNSMARTLVAQRAALARTNQLDAWNQMARQVAHEIKNPLTPIQLAAEHLQRVHEDRHRPLGTLVDQCVGTVLGQVRLLRQIASEFANFSSEHVPRPTELALGDIIESVVGPYRLGLANHVTVETDVPGDLPPILADRTLLSRALTNLVENAVQAMPDGGLLRVAIRHDPPDIVLTIADTGAGMDPETLARVFEPYFSTKTGGSGLGLPNAKRNIELSGGTIAVDSTPSRGTTMTIRLPAAAAVDRDVPADAQSPSR